MSKIQIFELFGSILLKDQGVESKLNSIDKKAGGTAKSMGLSFGSIAGAALKLGAILGAGMGIKDMIDKAAAGEKKMAQMDAVLKSTKGAAGMTKDELLKLADAQGKLTTFSKGANMETENLLLTFTSIGKKVFPDALKTVNNMSQALGQDTKSSAIQLGKALQDPIKGITALSRVGVNFTAQQKEAIKHMVKLGDVAGAQKLILKELETEFGGSAEAAGKTFSGQMEIAKNQVSGMGAAIGSALLPTLTSMITTINTNMPAIKQAIMDVINYVIPKFQEWGKLIGDIATNLLPSFGKATDDTKTKATDLAKNGMNFVTDALKWLKDNIGTVKDGVIALTAVWLLEKAAVLVLNIAQGARNIALVAGKIATTALSIATGIQTFATKAYTIATSESTIATKAGQIAMLAFNLVMSLNPIVLVIAGLVLLGAAIYEVVKHWQEIVTWITKAWSWLTTWNGTKAQDKNATVNTNYTQTGQGALPHNAAGTDNWRGGLTHINELGGEIVDLPKGSRVIPHDVSMAMAKNSGGNTNTIHVAQMVVREEADIQKISQELFRLQQNRNRSMGVTN